MDKDLAEQVVESRAAGGRQRRDLRTTGTAT